ncbi:hypothetical protein [Mesorhizobium sp. NPDC059025]|uniref:sunset domain-containing protein n=1 Tax=unclassified Mesorhizobium TaxID=325217 RepID=UPI00367D63EC
MRGSPFAIALLIVGAGGFGYFSDDLRNAIPSPAAFSKSDCVIKGNISISSGEHIYHVPGQYDYDSTIIRPEYGERWFCTEVEARQAGWRRAGR